MELVENAIDYLHILPVFTLKGSKGVMKFCDLKVLKNDKWSAVARNVRPWRDDALKDFVGEGDVGAKGVCHFATHSHLLQKKCVNHNTIPQNSITLSPPSLRTFGASLSVKKVTLFRAG
jgi:hypothetical protein